MRSCYDLKDCVEDGSFYCLFFEKAMSKYPEDIQVDLRSVWIYDEMSEDSENSGKADDIFSIESPPEETVKRVDLDQVKLILPPILRMFKLGYLCDLLFVKDDLSLCVVISILISKLGAIPGSAERDLSELVTRAITQYSQSNEISQGGGLEDALEYVKKALDLCKYNHFFYINNILKKSRLLFYKKDFFRSLECLDYVWEFAREKHSPYRNWSNKENRTGYIEILVLYEIIYLRLSDYKKAKECIKLREEYIFKEIFNEHKSKSDDVAIERKKAHERDLERIRVKLQICDKGIKKMHELEIMRTDFVSKEFKFIQDQKIRLGVFFKKLEYFSSEVTKGIFGDTTESSAIVGLKRKLEPVESGSPVDEKAPSRLRTKSILGFSRNDYSFNFFNKSELEKVLTGMKEKLQILVIGPTSSGKSKLVNKLIGRDEFLPVSTTRCTSCLTVLKHVEEDRERVVIWNDKNVPPLVAKDIDNTKKSMAQKGNMCSYLAVKNHQEEGMKFFECQESESIVCCGYCAKKCHSGFFCVELKEDELNKRFGEEGIAYCQCYQFHHGCRAKKENRKHSITKELDEDWQGFVNQKKEDRRKNVNHKVEIFMDFDILKFTSIVDSPGVTESEEMKKLVGGLLFQNQNDVLMFVFNGTNVVESYWDHFFKEYGGCIEKLPNEVLVVVTRLDSFINEFRKKEREVRNKLDEYFGSKKYRIFFVNSLMDDDEFVTNTPGDILLEYRCRFAEMKKNVYEAITKGSFILFEKWIHVYIQESSNFNMFSRSISRKIDPGFDKRIKRRNEALESKRNAFEELYNRCVRKVASEINSFWKREETNERLLEITKECEGIKDLEKEKKQLFDWIRYPDGYLKFLERSSVIYQDHFRKYMLSVQGDIRKELMEASKKHSFGELDEDVFGAIKKARDLKYHETSGITHLFERQKRRKEEKDSFIYRAVKSSVKGAGLVLDYCKEISITEPDPLKRLVEAYLKKQRKKKHIKECATDFFQGLKDLTTRIIDDEILRLRRDEVINNCIKTKMNLPPRTTETLYGMEVECVNFYFDVVLGHISRMLPFPEKCRIGEKRKCRIFGDFTELLEPIMKEKEEICEGEGEEEEECEGEGEEKVMYLKKTIRITPSSNNHGVVSDVLTLSSLDHRNILGIRGVKVSIGELEKKIIFDIELALDKFDFSLTDYLSADPTLEDRLKVIDEVLKGLKELWRNNIVCKDLNPRKIMVQSNPLRVMICDFNINTLSTKFSNGVGITSKFSSPEVKKGFPYSRRSDVFSFGRLVFCVLSHCDLKLISISKKKKLKGIDNFKRLPGNLGGKVGPDIQKFVKDCTRKERTHRLNVNEMCSDWGKLRKRIKYCLFFKYASLWQDEEKKERIQGEQGVVKRVFLRYRLESEFGDLDVSSKVELIIEKKEKDGVYIQIKKVEVLEGEITQHFPQIGKRLLSTERAFYRVKVSKEVKVGDEEFRAQSRTIEFSIRRLLK